MSEDLAQSAQRLLNDHGFGAILRTLKNDTLIAWANTDPAATAAREAHWHDIQAIGRIEGRLKAIVQSKTLDDRKAARAEQRAERTEKLSRKRSVDW